MIRISVCTPRGLAGSVAIIIRFWVLVVYRKNVNSCKSNTENRDILLTKHFEKVIQKKNRNRFSRSTTQNFPADFRHLPGSSVFLCQMRESVLYWKSSRGRQTPGCTSLLSRDKRLCEWPRWCWWTPAGLFAYTPLHLQACRKPLLSASWTVEA